MQNEVEFAAPWEVSGCRGAVLEASVETELPPLSPPLQACVWTPQEMRDFIANHLGRGRGRLHYDMVASIILSTLPCDRGWLTLDCLVGLLLCGQVRPSRRRFRM